MYFKKVCPIDMKVFYSRKISTIYCSKKCSNKTRYMPSQFVAKLVQAVQQHMMTVKGYQESVMTEDNSISDVTAIGYTPKGATKEHPLGEEEGYLTGLALLVKSKIQPKIVHKTGFHLEKTPMDPEMKDFMLEDDDETHLSTMNETQLANIEHEQTQPKKYKIRRIGEKT